MTLSLLIFFQLGLLPLSECSFTILLVTKEENLTTYGFGEVQRVTKDSWDVLIKQTQQTEVREDGTYASPLSSNCNYWFGVKSLTFQFLEMAAPLENLHNLMHAGPSIVADSIPNFSTDVQGKKITLTCANKIFLRESDTNTNMEPLQGYRLDNSWLLLVVGKPEMEALSSLFATCMSPTVQLSQSIPTETRNQISIALSDISQICGNFSVIMLKYKPVTEQDNQIGNEQNNLQMLEPQPSTCFLKFSTADSTFFGVGLIRFHQTNTGILWIGRVWLPNSEQWISAGDDSILPTIQNIKTYQIAIGDTTGYETEIFNKLVGKKWITLDAGQCEKDLTINRVMLPFNTTDQVLLRGNLQAAKIYRIGQIQEITESQWTILITSIWEANGANANQQIVDTTVNWNNVTNIELKFLGKDQLPSPNIQDNINEDQWLRTENFTSTSVVDVPAGCSNLTLTIANKVSISVKTGLIVGTTKFRGFLTTSNSIILSLDTIMKTKWDDMVTNSGQPFLTLKQQGIKATQNIWINDTKQAALTPNGDSMLHVSYVQLSLVDQKFANSSRCYINLGSSIIALAEIKLYWNYTGFVWIKRLWNATSNAYVEVNHDIFDEIKLINTCQFTTRSMSGRKTPNQLSDDGKKWKNMTQLEFSFPAPFEDIVSTFEFEA